MYHINRIRVLIVLTELNGKNEQSQEIQNVGFKACDFIFILKRAFNELGVKNVCTIRFKEPKKCNDDCGFQFRWKIQKMYNTSIVFII